MELYETPQRGSLCILSRLKVALIIVVPALLALGIGLLIGFTARPSSNDVAAPEPLRDGDPAISGKIQAEINADNIREHLKDITSQPQLAGTEADKRQADKMVSFWREQGLETRLHKYNILLSYPNRSDPNLVQLVNTTTGHVMFETAVAEKVLTNEHNQSDVVPPFNAYSPAGSPQTASLVYVNYGRVEDFEWLRDQGVRLNGSLAIARYGRIFRGNKVKFAEQFGCVGVILYSDPADYAPEPGLDTFPNTTWLPDTGVQRGNIVTKKGDPLTPGYPSLDSAYRLSEDEAALPGIPAHPISYGDARVILRELDGPEAPEAWRGDLNVTYRIGPGLKNAQMSVRLHVATYTSRRDIYNAVALVRGAVEPDRYVIMGNHRDAWVFGAVDPSSGTAAMLELSRTIAKLVNDGWRPRRTVMFVSWGAEEYGLMGSYEWVEQYTASLGQRAVAYLNVDIAMNGNYSMRAKTSPLLENLLFESAKKVRNPNPAEVAAGRETVYDTWLHSYPDAADPDKPRVSAIGSGSDFAIFAHRVGVSCAGLRYNYNSYKISSYPLYHSAYETFYLVDALMDRGFKYHAAVAGMWGEMGRALADQQVLPLDVAAYGRALLLYVADVTRRYGHDMAANGLQPNLDNLGNATERFNTATKAFVDRLSSIDKTDELLVRRVNDQMMQLERAFIDPLGLPGRPLDRHVIFAPSSRNHYASDNFPGLEDTIFGIDRLSGEEKEQQWDLVKKELARLSFIILSAASTLDDVTEFKDSVPQK